jgi:hypothetical protein
MDSWVVLCSPYSPEGYWFGCPKRLIHKEFHMVL